MAGEQVESSARKRAVSLMGVPELAGYRNRLKRLREATTAEVIEELVRRRAEALRVCTEEELLAELAGRPGIDLSPREQPPRVVEK